MLYTCRQCGKQFKASASAKRKLRSRACCFAAQRGNKYAKGAVRSVKTRAKISAAQIGNKGATGKNNGLYKTGRFVYVTRTCLVCGKEFRTEKYQVDKGCGKYCSRKCYGQALIPKFTGVSNPQWLGGISYEPYTGEFNEQLKRRIRERDGYACQICGEANSKHVHHINFDKKDCRQSNLITLCCSCHSKVNFQRGFWMGALFTQVWMKNCEFWTHRP